MTGPGSEPQPGDPQPNSKLATCPGHTPPASVIYHVTYQFKPLYLLIKFLSFLVNLTQMSSIDRLTGSSRFCEMYFPHLLYLQPEGINPVIPLMSKNHLSYNHPSEISSTITP